MNINTPFSPKKFLPATRILLAIILTGFSYSTFAVTDVVSDDQIRRVAKIARATKTNITITKERVTVTVHGGSGRKSARRVKKTVSRIMKQRNYVPKQVGYYEDEPEFLHTAPVLNNNKGFRPPALSSSGNRQPPTLGSSGYRQPPTLEGQSSSSQPPALERANGAEDSGYY